jgi:hypothetical protein
MFPLTITLTNAAQLNAVMLALNIDQVLQEKIAAVIPENKPAEKVAAKKSATVTTPEAPATIPPIATAEVAAAVEKKADAPDSPKSISYDEVAKAILAVSSKYGRAAAMSILTKHGLGESLKNAKPDQFAAIKADALAAVGA